MTNRMQDKVVAVFGGVSGIGYETVRLLISEGASVLVADLNADKGRELSEQFGEKIKIVRCDVSSEDDVARALDTAVSTFGKLDSVINNAGIQFSGEAAGFSLDSWQKIMAVNAGGAFLVAKHSIPYLLKTGAGSITNTASTAGLRGGPGMTAYSASKGAIVAFGRALAMELGGQNIRVNTVCPGWTDTAFNGPIIDILGGVSARDAVIKNSVPLQRQAHPREIAQIYVYLASDESSYMTGQAVVVDGGLI